MGSLKKFYPIIAWKWKTNDEGFGYDKERKKMIKEKDIVLVLNQKN